MGEDLFLREFTDPDCGFHGIDRVVFVTGHGVKRNQHQITLKLKYDAAIFVDNFTRCLEIIIQHFRKLLGGKFL